MTEVGQASSNNWLHLACVGSLALGAIGVVSILHRSHAVDFQPYFGNLHPVAAVALAAAIGIVALHFLVSRGWFVIYATRGCSAGIGLSAGSQLCSP